MCAPSPPAPPDYAAQAQAQGAANKEAAIASNLLNNPNVVNPYGTQTWSGGQDGSRPTMVQTFSPTEQRLYDQNSQTKTLLSGLGTQGATALQGVVGKRLDLTDAPAVKDYGGTRDKVLAAMMGRADEDYTKQQMQANSELVAAGIRPGTKAYEDRMQMIERSRNDARNLAEVSAGNATAQAFNTDSQRRKDAIAEILAQRQSPLNEITALISGSQVNNPFAVPGAAQNSNVAPAPIFGAAQAQDQAATGLYNADAARSTSTTNAAIGAGAAALAMMF